MQENRNELEFKKLAKKYSDSGLFTHLYAECGKLDSKPSQFKYSIIPDEREFFDLASMTKGLVTAPLIFNEIVAGLDITTTVKSALSKVNSQDLSPKLLNLTIKQLLSHRSGLPWWRNFYVNCSADERSKQAEDLEARLVMGLNRAAEQLNPKKEAYSDSGFLLLGLILKRRTGKTLADQFRIFYPQSESIGYPETIDHLATRAVPTSFCAIRGRSLCGEVHDENSAALGGVTGHAGLFGSGSGVSSYLKFLSQTAAGKELISSNASAAEDKSNVNLLMGLWRGGDFTDGDAGSFAIGHPGFTGTAFWISPKQNSYAVLLTNRVVSGRRPGNDIKTLRKESFRLLYAISAA